MYGYDTRARYATDGKGNEKIETEYYERQRPEDLKQVGSYVLQDALDILNVYGAGRANPSDLLFTKTGGNHFIRPLKELVKDVPGIARKMTNKQSGASFGFQIKDGKIVFNGKGIGEGLYDFVITESGELRIGRGHYVLSGEASRVKGAGRIYVNSEGKIDYIDEYSGHYAPNHQELINQASMLKEAGLTAENFDVV